MTSFPKVDKIWMDGRLINWDEAKIHVLSHTLHYGSGVFEGIRCYATDRGPAIFRLREHIDRLYKSARVFHMKIAWTKEEICEACSELIRVNRLESGYLRPLVFFGYGMLGLNPGNNPVSVVLAAWPWGKYLDDEKIRVKVSRFIRIHPRSTIANAKLCGHYVNSILASQEAKESDYHEALLLDYNGYVAEGPGENLFLVKDGILKTPPLGAILPGITRASVLELASDLGYEVEEVPLTVAGVQAADEAFFTGTAAEVTPIHQIDETILGTGKVGPVTTRIRKEFYEIVSGRRPRYDTWLTYVSRAEFAEPARGAKPPLAAAGDGHPAESAR
ncbi:MAG: branched-chain amino acid transaminase [Candidatus Eisenbacteria bacterium]|nr:branched-chain amino acid transaminase [Candidatus Eisenbacteria bacterium]